MEKVKRRDEKEGCSCDVFFNQNINKIPSSMVYGTGILPCFFLIKRNENLFFVIFI